LAFAGTLNLLTHFTNHFITCHCIYHSSHLHVRQLLLLLLFMKIGAEDERCNYTVYHRAVGCRVNACSSSENELNLKCSINSRLAKRTETVVFVRYFYKYMKRSVFALPTDGRTACLVVLHAIHCMYGDKQIVSTSCNSNPTLWLLSTYIW